MQSTEYNKKRIRGKVVEAEEKQKTTFTRPYDCQRKTSDVITFKLKNENKSFFL